MTATTNPPEGGAVQDLSLTEGGCSAVRSADPGGYVLDLDDRLVLDRSGAGSFTGPDDRVRVSLAAVDGALTAAMNVTGGVWNPFQVGPAHVWHLDPKRYDPVANPRWWLQDQVTVIQAAAPGQRPAGRTPAPADAGVPHRHHPADPHTVAGLGDRKSG